MERRTALRSFAAGIALAIAGCGDGGGDGNDTDGETTEAETPTEGETTEGEMETTEGETETPEDGETTEDGAGTGQDVAQTVQVGAGDGFSFDPAQFTISTGDTVVWEWVQGEHNIVPESVPEQSDWQGTQGGPEETYTDHTYEFTFETAGEYQYYCNVHQDLGMNGSFTVEEGGGTGTGETPTEETPGGDTPSDGTTTEESPGDETETPGSGTGETTTEEPSSNDTDA